MSIIRPPFTIETAAPKVRAPRKTRGTVATRCQCRSPIPRTPSGEIEIGFYKVANRFENSSHASGNESLTIASPNHYGPASTTGLPSASNTSTATVAESGSAPMATNFGSLKMMG